MGILRHLAVGAAVLLVTAVVWWALATGLSYVIPTTFAGMAAIGVILAAGWVANGLLLWRQSRREPRKPG